ncbi:hypothetical protein BGZ63DRAFT_401432 [Mariannaea sp. PMI_226]|nr:hypothetical protein BGZ63DRAFT_401432 [Mariannaea sp. PMI_226]
MERRSLAGRGFAKIFGDRGRSSSSSSSSIRNKKISYPKLQSGSTLSPPEKTYYSILREEKVSTSTSTRDRASSQETIIARQTFSRMKNPRVISTASNMAAEKSPSFKFDPSQFRRHPPSRDEVGCNVSGHGLFRASSPSIPKKIPMKRTIIQTKTVRRSEVMMEGRDILKKIKKYSLDQSALAPEIEIWLDQHKVKVLTEEAKNLVAWWASSYSQAIVDWMRGAVEDIEEHTYTSEVPQDDPPTLRWCHMMARPLRELRLTASAVGDDYRQKLLSLVDQIENGFTWLDRQEQQRQDASSAAMRKDAEIRNELDSTTRRLQKSESRMEEMLRKMSEMLRMNELKNHAVPSKKRRLASNSDRTRQVAGDVQDLIDTLTYQLSTTSSAFVQLKTVAKHFGPEVSGKLDFNRDRCLSRRKLRANEFIGM